MARLISSNRNIRSLLVWSIIAAIFAGAFGARTAMAAFGNSHGANYRQTSVGILVDIHTDDGQARTVRVSGMFPAIDMSSYALDLQGRLQVTKWPYVGHSSTAVSETGYEYTISWQGQGIDTKTK